jgi:hypothetical protein
MASEQEDVEVNLDANTDGFLAKFDMVGGRVASWASKVDGVFGKLGDAMANGVDGQSIANRLGGTLGSALGMMVGGPLGAQLGDALGRGLGEAAGAALDFFPEKVKTLEDQWDNFKEMGVEAWASIRASVASIDFSTIESATSGLITSFDTITTKVGDFASEAMVRFEDVIDSLTGIEGTGKKVTDILAQGFGYFMDVLVKVNTWITNYVSLPLHRLIKDSITPVIEGLKTVGEWLEMDTSGAEKFLTKFQDGYEKAIEGAQAMADKGMAHEFGDSFKSWNLDGVRDRGRDLIDDRTMRMWERHFEEAMDYATIVAEEVEEGMEEAATEVANQTFAGRAVLSGSQEAAKLLAEAQARALGFSGGVQEKIRQVNEKQLSEQQASNTHLARISEALSKRQELKVV